MHILEIYGIMLCIDEPPRLRRSRLHGIVASPFVPEVAVGRIEATWRRW